MKINKTNKIFRFQKFQKTIQPRKTKSIFALTSPLLITPLVFVACGVSPNAQGQSQNTNKTSNQHFANSGTGLQDAKNTQFHEFTRNTSKEIDLNNAQDFDITQYKSMKDAIQGGLRIRDINRDLFTRFGKNEADKDYFNVEHLFWSHLDTTDEQRQYSGDLLGNKPKTGGGIDNLLKFFAGTDLVNTPISKLVVDPFPFKSGASIMNYMSLGVSDHINGNGYGVYDLYQKEHPGPLTISDEELKASPIPKEYQSAQSTKSFMDEGQQKYATGLAEYNDKTPDSQDPFYTITSNSFYQYKPTKTDTYSYLRINELNRKLARLYNGSNYEFYLPLLKEIERHKEFSSSEIFQAFNDVITNGSSTLLPGFNMYGTYGLKQDTVGGGGGGDADITIDRQLKDIANQVSQMGYNSILSSTSNIQTGGPGDSDTLISDYQSLPIINATEVLTHRGEDDGKSNLNNFSLETIEGAGKLFIQKMLDKDPFILNKIPMLRNANTIQYKFLNPNGNDIRNVANLFAKFSGDLYNLDIIIRQFRTTGFYQNGIKGGDGVFGYKNGNYIPLTNPESTFIQSKEVLKLLDRKFNIDPKDDPYVNLTSGLPQGNNDLGSARPIAIVYNPLAYEAPGGDQRAKNTGLDENGNSIRS